MSRGLQMLVEEGEYSSCVHAVRTVGKSKPATVFCRNRPREAKPPTVFAEIGVRSRKIAIFYRKMEKTARRRPTKCKITRFLLFARKRNAKLPNFYSSLVSETQNRPFSAFPPAKQDHKPGAFNEDRVPVIPAWMRNLCLII